MPHPNFREVGHGSLRPVITTFTSLGRTTAIAREPQTDVYHRRGVHGNALVWLAADGISDLDLVYFDPLDISVSSENEHAERIRRMFPELPVWIDVKNEARVHLWYEAKFGRAIAPYASVMDAIDTFPTTATTVGMRPSRDGAETYATFGLSDLFAGIVRANKRLITREIYEAKCSKWRARWPDLTVIPWDGD